MQAAISATPVTITTPADGSNVAFAPGPPATTPCNGTIPNTTQSMTYQIGMGAANAINNFNAAQGTWSLPNLTDSDCPTVNQTYTLYVNAFDAQGNPTTGQSTFTRTA